MKKIIIYLVILCSSTLAFSEKKSPIKLQPITKSTIQRGSSFIYQSDFDENGILYWLGTEMGTKSWVNPALNKSVIIMSSPLITDSEPSYAIVGRTAVRCSTTGIRNSWFIIIFADDLLIEPTHYTLRHYSSWDTECLRNWKLEGSANGTDWYVLKEHVDDQNLNGKGDSHTWAIQNNNETRMFKMFRIITTGRNSNGHHYFALSGFEMYGRVYSSVK